MSNIDLLREYVESERNGWLYGDFVANAALAEHGTSTQEVLDWCAGLSRADRMEIVLVAETIAKLFVDAVAESKEHLGDVGDLASRRERIEVVRSLLEKAGIPHGMSGYLDEADAWGVEVASSLHSPIDSLCNDLILVCSAAKNPHHWWTGLVPLPN